MSILYNDVLDVSRETLDRLHQLEALVVKWTPVINLISKGSGGDIWSRHILDSAQLFDISESVSGHWVDLGSGGGFPGLVVAILAAEKRAELRFTLVESDKRKATFLRQAAQILDLKLQVRAERIEVCSPLEADIISARALAPLSILCGFSSKHLVSAGAALFLKGAKHEQEVEDARKIWNFDLTTTPSRTDPAGAILMLKGLHLA